MSDWFPGPAWLFCPADRPERYATALAAADVVILDLEDAVAPERKAFARDALREAFASGDYDAARLVVRINGADSAEHAHDLMLIEELALPRVMLAKAESAHDARAVPCEVIGLVETARGIEWAGAIAEVANVIGLMWGADDLVASMGGTGSRRADGSYRDVARFARIRALTAAKACGLFALDAVHMEIRDLDGLGAECEDAVASGFDGTVAIHPGQIATIRSAYRPSEERIDWARRLLAEVGSEGGVATFEGRMVDGPIYRQAERILLLADLTASPEQRGVNQEQSP